MDFTAIVQRIQDRTGAKLRGNGIRCPAHNDRAASLSVSTGDDGRVLLFCHAGCATERICAALGIGMADLMSPRTQTPRPSNGSGRVHPTMQAAFNAALWGISHQEPQAKLARTWTYLDASRKPVAAVARFDLPTAIGERQRKEFRPFHAVSGGWCCGDPAALWPLYRAPDLTGTPTIFVVEGEACADALVNLGLAATTSAHGAKSPQKSGWAAVHGKAVVIIPDHDQPGRDYAEAVARLCHAAGSSSIRIADLADLWPAIPDHGDVADWLADGLSDSVSPEQAAGDLQGLAERAKPWVTPEAVPAAAPTGATAALRCCANIPPETVRWVWTDVLPLGMVSMLAGDPGLGKSHLALDLAARVSTGSDMPDGSPGIRGDVLLLSAEDSAACTIIPRLNAASADLNRVHILDGRKLPDGTAAPIGLEDIGIIEDALQRCKGTGLVVVDPVSAYLGNADSHVNSEVRGLLRPLGTLAEKYGCAILLVSHLTKSPGTKAAYRATGSLAFTALARAAWLVCEDSKGTDGDRLFTCIKSNIGPSNRGFRFRRLVSGCLDWDATGIQITAQEALAAAEQTRGGDEPKRGPLGEKKMACGTWLRDYLSGGEKLAADLEQAALDSGYSIGTLRRAKKDLGIESFRRETTGPWSCILSGAQPHAQPLPRPKLAHLDGTRMDIGFRPDAQGPHAQVIPGEGKLAHVDPGSGLVDPVKTVESGAESVRESIVNHGVGQADEGGVF